ncbi:hypothetical protein SI65_00775 [Aspergillus cristatus]|uniref:RING finger protein ETP1 n=1 Tax=Aspergillus cristatus TaxID=573508 RepID=A0A1E3BS42_ASPCR|nr:hypothetical protein SI65_00775 [Aspergillus cristatus]
MPSYFYHLAIELFARPLTDLGAASGLDDQSTSLSFDSACEALRPFQKPIRPSSRRSRASPSDKSKCLSPPNLPIRSASSSVSNTRIVDNAILTTSNNTTTFHPYTKSHSSATDIQHDQRLDKVSIECIDMVCLAEREHTSTTPSSKRKVHFTDNPVTTGIGTDILGGLRTKGRYIPLDQETTDSVWGIVHLYRDAQETPYLIDDDYPVELKGSSAAARQPGDQVGHYGDIRVEGDSPDEECTTLCILAVPSYLSPSDFLGFVGETTMDDVSHFRMIRTARANRYMVLMKFRSGNKAKEWQRVWNGKVFNSMEPETCHVVFVNTVEIQAVAGTPSGLGSSFQNTLATNSTKRGSISSQSQSNTIPSVSTKPLAPRTPSLIELPTCPVCLERMDETTGLLTIICQHVFHCTCLQKWKGSGCPVCRYTQNDFRRTSQSEDEPAECHVCHSDINLWVCLICGTVGCGRYDGAHAYEHFKESTHAFAMDLSTQRVWDYLGDAYVHRIIQNKGDGKLVELPAADNSALDPPDWTDAVPREKLENMSVEYTHLLTSQLESQRAYFEEVVERAADKASQASAAASSAQEAAEKATLALTNLQFQYDKLNHETLPGVEHDKARAEKRAEKFEGMARKLEKEWREEKTMNESLLKRIEFLSTEVRELKETNTDLSEQNRDLTFFISGSQRLMDQGEDVQQGTVSVPKPEVKGKKKKGKGKGRG